ncbi:hypothetical protein B0G84_8087 [Paraburkholderia sp. BL8N3]|nr:M50 family metallopeptidase [Paraburkholderia sp. BL8N3]TCK33768.1 hypothetical protein B0G84_8087 [Paraburkholderia sp. BL8N3]
MNNEKSPFIFIILTPIFFILALWVSVFPHEYAHAITAWLFGYKLGPFDIAYGKFNWQNVLFVDGIDEHVNYFIIYMFGDTFAMGMIAFMGPFMSVILYFLSLYLLRLNSIKKRPYLLYFVFWVNATNLSELISYVALRSITRHGDIGHIEFAWGVSQWFIFIAGCVVLSIATLNFFSRTIVELYLRTRTNSMPLRYFFLILFSFLLFAYAGVRVLIENNGVFSMSLSIIFCVITPVIVVICWPTREWVKEREKTYVSYSGNRALGS